MQKLYALPIACILAACSTPRPPPQTAADLEIQQADGSVRTVHFTCQMVVNPEIHTGANSGLVEGQGAGAGFSHSTANYPAVAQIVEVDYTRYTACVSFLNAPMTPEQRMDYLLSRSKVDSGNSSTFSAATGSAPIPIPPPNSITAGFPTLPPMSPTGTNPATSGTGTVGKQGAKK